jgi:hypothetical protein
MPRYIGGGKASQAPGGSKKYDYLAARRALLLVRRHLMDVEQREVGAVLLVRDMDAQPDTRRRSLEDARADADVPGVAVVLGIAHPKREAWVLNGFVPQDDAERARLRTLRRDLGFDPCTDADRLTATRTPEGEQATTNPKRVLDLLVDGDTGREADCWRATPLATLRTRGKATGLAAFLGEVEARLRPLLGPMLGPTR